MTSLETDAGCFDQPETDAHPRTLPPNDVDWTQCLIEVDGGLDDGDIEQIKFLLRGFLSDAKLKKIQRGTGLFEELNLLGHINIESGRFELLEECLYRVHRKDLIRKLGGKNPNHVKQRLDRLKKEIRNNTEVNKAAVHNELPPFRLDLVHVYLIPACELTMFTELCSLQPSSFW